MKQGIALAMILTMATMIARLDLWAEPLPEPEKPAFYVQIREHKAENDIEMEVETIFDEQIELLARCVESEAGNQSQLGKRLVADVILNRVESEDFPDGIEGVINQKGQFSVVSNGSIDKAVPSAETWEAVAMEMNRRIDENILYFKAGSYPAYGEPVCQVDKHFFSK